MWDLFATIKALMLMPAAFVGTMTGFAVSGQFEAAPGDGVVELALFILLIVVINLAVVGAIVLMLRGRGWFFGHGSGIWAFLVVVAYGAGFSAAMLL